MFGGRRYQGVTAFVGMPGSGKTYGLVRVAKRAMEQGRAVYTNQGFDVKGARTYRSFEEMLLIPPGSVILLDEAPVYFNARRWQEFPDGLLYRLTQIRKDGLEFYYSAIHEEMVDATLRRLTFWFWHCRAISGRLLYWTLWSPELFRRSKERPRKRELIRVNAKVAALYDTNGKVAISEKHLHRLREISAQRWITVEPGMSLDELLRDTGTPAEDRAGAADGDQDAARSSAAGGAPARRGGPRRRRRTTPDPADKLIPPDAAGTPA
jgi:hypothetical protein